MAELINVIIDGKPVKVKKGTVVLHAAEKLNIKIPTLCYLKDVNSPAACRVCLVQLKKTGQLRAACTLQCEDGMEILTGTKDVINARRLSVELLISDHPRDCLVCSRNGNCELQSLCRLFGIEEVRYKGKQNEFKPDDSNLSLYRDMSKCVKCGRCVSACSNIQTVYALELEGRGFEMAPHPAFGRELKDSPCTYCGQCSLVCPTGAITVKEAVNEFWDDVLDKDKITVAQIAPSVRVTIGEEFGEKPGTPMHKKMVTALKKLGIDYVFDTDFGADLTIMEEATEFISRVKKDGPFPMITSCSPGWVTFIEKYYPEFLKHLSTCKSPQQMLSAVVKTYFAEKIGVKPKNISMISIMPCTAKKFEAARPEMKSNKGVQDTDVVLTTRELAYILKAANINLPALEDTEFDNPLGESTGAAVIFGASGGVMEAALRTAYKFLTGKERDMIDFKDIRGIKGIKETALEVAGIKVKIAVANTLKNARVLLDEIKEGKSKYHFIEIMACPGGCIGGGGQPIPTNDEIRKERIKGIYKLDGKMTLRRSHENASIQKLYKEFLKEPGSHKSHELLHTKYTKRGIYKN